MAEEFEIKQYCEADAPAWNDFVKLSKQGTFLLLRDYMDYHADRFCDHSLLVFRKGELFALLPANVCGSTLYSHQGLTYGGLITRENATAQAICETFAAINGHLRKEGITKVVYKAIPHIYHRLPAEEDLYALFKVCRAKLIARDISSTIVMNQQLRWSRDRKYGINRCRNNGIVVEQSDDFEKFWKVLDNNLLTTYGVHPVHTLQEMLLLKSRFPHNIVLYTTHKDNEVLGGTVLYVTPQVVHAQYISASPEGKHLRVIDGIYDRILHEDFMQHKYFDFGKSTEDSGRLLNESLIHQKEGFGGRGVCYDTYEYDI